MENYKTLKVWQLAHQLTLDVYQITKAFPKEEIFCLTNQLRRCLTSVAANIVEGCRKNSQNDFANFLNISLGSANETEYYLLLSKDLKYITEKDFLILEDKINAIRAMIISLIKKVRTNK